MEDIECLDEKHHLKVLGIPQHGRGGHIREQTTCRPVQAPLILVITKDSLISIYVHDRTGQSSDSCREDKCPLAQRAQANNLAGNKREACCGRYRARSDHDRKYQGKPRRHLISEPNLSMPLRTVSIETDTVAKATVVEAWVFVGRQVPVACKAKPNAVAPPSAPAERVTKLLAFTMVPRLSDCRTACRGRSRFVMAARKRRLAAVGRSLTALSGGSKIGSLNPSGRITPDIWVTIACPEKIGEDGRLCITRSARTLPRISSRSRQPA
jgi:hypothetical protein